VVTIPAGQPFAGRSSGGATRSEVFGNQCVEYDYHSIHITDLLGTDNMEVVTLDSPAVAFQDVASLSPSGRSYGEALLASALVHTSTVMR
jgi:hypothetical protein